MHHPVGVRIGAALWLAPLALPLISIVRNPAVSPPAEGLVLAFFAIACTRPDLAVAGGAAILPLGFTLGAILGLRFPLTEPIALAIAGGCALRYVLRPRPLPAGAARALVWPALLALTAATSAAVLCATQSAFYASTSAFVRDLWDVLTFHYVVSVGRFGALRAAMAMIEGLALLTVAMVALDTPRARTLALRALLADGTIVATHNVMRLGQIALRSDAGFWADVVQQLGSARISAAFADVNAAGSFLVMVLVAAIVWSWRRRSAWTAALLPLLALALWIAGSRTALAAGALALAICLVPRRRWWVAGVLVLVAAGALFAAQSFRRAADPSSALFIRVELVKAGARMLRTEPLFGVGVGRFYTTSEHFISPELARFYVRENAHNQFVQVAGELGIIGLVAFVAIFWIVVRQVVRDRARPDPVRDASAAGLVAMLLSAIGGHPLLVDEVALPFWIVVGLTWAAASSGTAGDMADAGDAHVRGSRSRWRYLREWTLALAVILVVASVPWRIDRAQAALPLEHVGIGLSRWQRDADGHRYRVMRGQAAIYVPAGEQPARFLARVRPGGPAELRLALTLDGRLINEVALSREWREVKVVVPREGQMRYRRVELTVSRSDRSHAAAAVQIGIVR